MIAFNFQPMDNDQDEISIQDFVLKVHRRKTNRRALVSAAVCFFAA